MASAESTTSSMIIDFDSHLREGYFMDEVYKLDGPYERFRPVKLNDGRTHNTKFLHSLDPISPQGHAAHRHPYIYDPKTHWRGGDIAARQVGGYDMARRREDIGKEGIDKQLLFPTQITVATSNIGGLGRECARLFNDWVAKLVKGHENIFLPVAMAPAGCPVYPYYQAAEELGVPLLCHPNSNGELVDRFDNFYKTHVLGRPTNCSAALVALVLGGVFEKFPKLKVVFFECSAEWILYWMHRMDDDWEWAKDFPQISGMLRMAPSEYIRRNCYVTCEADEADLARPIAELGEDRILMASDYPHFDSEFPRTVASIRARKDLTERQKDKILGENAARLLNL